MKYSSFFAVCTLVGLAVAALAPGGPAHAAAARYKADSGTTSSTLFPSGDRRLDSLGFLGSPSVYTNANFLNFTDGQLSTNGTVYGWSAPIPRDMGTASNAHDLNPDRADASTPFMGESSGQGTLREVFSPFGSGYKNLSRILDGENATDPYSVDLLFGGGGLLSADSDPLTVELAILERGGNSDMNVYGIRSNGTLTPSLLLNRTDFEGVGWDMNTIEIPAPQRVAGIGVSLDSNWTDLKGFRIESSGTSMNGPDIVAVGTSSPAVTPEPGTLAILGCGLFALGRAGWRRRAAG